MSRDGSQFMGQLHSLHTDGCSGTEYSACRPVVVPGQGSQSAQIEVVFMAWCGDCEAADYELI